MEVLAEQFEQALTHLELKEKRKRVIAAHTEIRGLLEADGQLAKWGVDTVLIGSYARNTAIYPGKDVDVFTKLCKLDTGANPRLVYEAVLRLLTAKYGNQAKPQDRSIKVTWTKDGADDFAVDVVPAVRKGARWAIPNRDPERWKSIDANEQWQETDPGKLTELTSHVNATKMVNGRGAYVPVIKLVRQTRRHHRGDEKPGGLYFELMTYWAFKAGIEGDSFAQLFASTLRAIAGQLAGATPLCDPALDRNFAPEPDPLDRASAALLFDTLATKAANALTLEICPAAALWREILGRNDRGPCFPLPPGCDESGQKIRKVASVLATGSGEASGFA